MRKLLIIVDFQNDFICGSLGTPEAAKTIPNVISKVQNWEGDIIFTKDVHDENYLNTHEGKYLPVCHCFYGTTGYCIPQDVINAAFNDATNMRVVTSIRKSTFGSFELTQFIKNSMAFENKIYGHVELIGLCTDICVISNALILRSRFPDMDIAVDATCCAGTTPEKHKAALEVMKSCHIDVIGEQQ